jgi:hypothetical protein
MTDGQNAKTSRSVSVSAKLNSVIQVCDRFSGLPVVDESVSFELDGAPCKPLKKLDGFYVFFDIREDVKHEIRIICPGFIDGVVVPKPIQMPLSVPLAEMIQVCSLEPSPIYDYPVGTTLVVGHVSDTSGNVAGTQVFALYTDHNGEWRWHSTASYDTGAYDGCYAVALNITTSGTDVHLRFTKDGYATAYRQVQVTRGMTTIANIEMQVNRA